MTAQVRGLASTRVGGGRRGRSIAPATWAIYLIAVIGLVTLTLLTISPPRPTGHLDPQSGAPDGAMALRVLLQDRAGIEVVAARRLDELESLSDDRGTVFLTDGQAIRGGAASQLADAVRSARSVVAVDPSDDLARTLATPTSSGRTDGVPGALDAGCTTAEVSTGERLELRFPVTSWRVRDPGEGCYVLPNGRATLVRFTAHSRGPVIFVGTPEIFTNAGLDSADAAALAVRSLSQGSRVVWYDPDPADLLASGGPSSPVPPWFAPGITTLLAALALFSLARARRLGRLTMEPLPVVVRAQETTEARGRLYARSRDCAYAAAARRALAIPRLAHAVGLAPSAPLDALCAAVARATGRPEADVRRALLEPVGPADTTTFIAVSAVLTELEEEVHRR